MKHVATAVSAILLTCVSVHAQTARPATPPRSDTIVITASAPVHPNGGTLVPEIRIGTVSGSEDYQFTSIYDTALGKDGSIFVVDRGVRGEGASVRQFSRDGKFVRRFGRRGDGPGEWQVPIGVSQLPNNNVLVLSPRNNRIAVYKPDGTPLPHWLPSGSGGDHTSERLTSDVNGITWVRAFTRDMSSYVPFIWVRYDSTGRILDTVTVTAPKRDPRHELTAESPSSSRSARVPYTPDYVLRLSELGYFVTGMTGSFAVDMLIPPAGSRTWTSSTPVRSLRMSVPAVPVSGEERAEQRRQLELNMRQEVPRWTWNGVEIPQTKPAYKILAVGRDGRIWVGRSMPSERRASTRDIPGVRYEYVEASVFDVFEPNGRYLGKVNVPEGHWLQETSGDDVWLLHSDADGVQSLIRAKVTWR